MGKKMAKTPGAPAASRTHSPLAPTAQTASPTNMGYDDVSSADVYQAGIRAKTSSITSNADAAYGMKGTRGRAATNASAQFRITAKKAPYTEPVYGGTQASGRIMPSVMGQAQNFTDGGSTYGPMG